MNSTESPFAGLTAEKYEEPKPAPEERKSYAEMVQACVEDAEADAVLGLGLYGHG